MANNLNSCHFTGRITRDIELKYTNSGTAVGNFALAVNKKIKQNEQWVDKVNFFDFTLWGKTAENISRYLRKGQLVRVSTEAEQQTWEKDGQKRSAVRFTIREIELLGGKNESNQQQSAPAQGAIPDDFDDDIPF